MTLSLQKLQDLIPKPTEILYFAMLVVEKLWNVLYHTILTESNLNCSKDGAYQFSEIFKGT